ncbi:ComEA family DNA-binding protein [Pedobacter sp. Leaf250]|uniref:ComEA family DNA-binding protein n=1 Tax=Pedobacter sp. Leaf250 TaxID=2876559 RepID=UPI001E57EE3A|nr:helix-hairpin-helix domain-containing protein [Pedobacter sp. Leaf250]
MRIWLNKHFGFSKGEFNGLLILILIIVFIKLIPIIYVNSIQLEKDDPNLLAKIQKIEITDQQNFQYTRDRIETSNGSRKVTLFNFDPNSLNAEGWQSLGLSRKQAQSIVNYTNKGGKFYKAEDLQKMYTISPEMYKKLIPYVRIENQTSNYPKREFTYEKKEYVKKPLVIVDINTADSAQLDEIKGIGGTFANRILKYRERLGGFYKKEQLMEVYGLDSTRYEEIKNQITISTVSLKVVNLNTAQFNDLKGNPYLSYKQINAIIQYRKQHGNYSSLADLKKIAILNQQVIDKITPYISF